MEDASIIQAVIETTVPITSKVFNNILEELDITGKSTIKVDSIDSMVAVKPPDKMDDYGVYYRALSKCGGVIGYWYINNKTGPLPGVNNKLLLQYSGDKERMMRDIETVREFDSNYRKMIVTT
jgi:hypothetical protein